LALAYGAVVDFEDRGWWGIGHEEAVDADPDVVPAFEAGLALSGASWMRS
jgi:hypothetical protein